MIKQLLPYLNFNGTAGKAIALYEKALGAKTESLQRFDQIPGNQPAPENAHLVIHALLRIGSFVLMISDAQPSHPVPPAGNVHVMLDFDDLTDMKTKFEALSSGGRVTVPLEDTFWGATFGMVTDAYGISWMFNCNKK